MATSQATTLFGDLAPDLVMQPDMNAVVARSASPDPTIVSPGATTRARQPVLEFPPPPTGCMPATGAEASTRLAGSPALPTR